MARTTLSETIAELYALVDDVDVESTYDFEPANREMWLPSALTIYVAAWTPDSWVILLRLYVEMVEGSEEAQTKLYALAVEVENRLSAAYGPSSWTFEYDRELGLQVGTLTLEVGREDYF